MAIQQARAMQPLSKLCFPSRCIAAWIAKARQQCSHLRLAQGRLIQVMTPYLSVRIFSTFHSLSWNPMHSQAQSGLLVIHQRTSEIHQS
jgi:hypothetical protein